MANYWTDCKACGVATPSGTARVTPYGYCDKCRDKMSRGMTEDEVKVAGKVQQSLTKILRL